MDRNASLDFWQVCRDLFQNNLSVLDMVVILIIGSNLEIPLFQMLFQKRNVNAISAPYVCAICVAYIIICMLSDTPLKPNWLPMPQLMGQFGI